MFLVGLLVVGMIAQQSAQQAVHCKLIRAERTWQGACAELWGEKPTLTVSVATSIKSGRYQHAPEPSAIYAGEMRIPAGVVPLEMEVYVGGTGILRPEGLNWLVVTNIVARPDTLEFELDPTKTGGITRGIRAPRLMRRRYADTSRNDLGLNRHTPLAYHCVHAVRRDVRVYGGASPAPRRRTVPAAADGFDAPARARTDHQRVRWPPQDPVGPAGVGKRGGVRVIYYWAPVEAVFYMLYIYAKTEQGDLTPQQVRALAKVVREEFK